MTLSPPANNPLLKFDGLPDFTAILPEHIAPALDYLIATAQQHRQALLSEAASPNWDNLVQPLEDDNEKIHRMWSPVSHLNAVMNSDALRQEYEACLPKLTAYSTEVAQDERLYSAYRTISQSNEFENLNTAQQKIISNTLRDFRLAGAELSTKDKKRFTAIQQELSQLANTFQNNVLDATQGWWLHIENEKSLVGVPDFAREIAQQVAAEKNLDGWCFTLEGPSYLAFMTYADARELREEMYTAYVCRASEQGPNAGQWDNGKIILQLLSLRKQASALLGYANYAEMSLVTKMATDVDQVMQFLNDLASKSKPLAEQEIKTLSQFAQQRDGVSSLAAWDVAYYSEKLREQQFNFSGEELRPYFPEARVLKGMFNTIERLYGMTVTPLMQVPTWHEDVKVFEIRQADGSVRGRFYLDLYARSNKRGGAWMDDCISRKRVNGEIQVPTAYLVCNFSAPVGGKLALFSHDEVITLFHEFGHGLHHMLTQIDYVGVAGINGVAWDAVELPSQFMENWCWQDEALAMIATHFETGEVLPTSLIEKLKSAKNFQSGMQLVRQLEFSLFDMQLHSTFESDSNESVQSVIDAVRGDVAVFDVPKFSRFQNSFGHIFSGGYAAGYYSYKWAEVLSADAFSKFEEQGIFDRATGNKFLQSVLEQGGSREPMDLFIEFRGREPEVDALLRHVGLLA